MKATFRAGDAVVAWAMVVGACGAPASTAQVRYAAPVDPAKAQITVLYDAFGVSPGMQQDWGYAALIEYGGKRILFDTGNNGDTLAQNAKAKGVDLSRLDFVVMSHRHGDHVGGLAMLRKLNPNVTIYAPKEGFGVFGADLPSAFYRKDESLPAEQRYYGGKPPDVMRFGTAWPGANLELVDQNTEIVPGMHIITLVSDKPGTLELRELSLAINTADGIVIVVGCSHPGVDKIVAAATQINPRIHMLVGGFHLVVAKDDEIDRIVTLLHDTFKVEYVAPGHCTGEPTFTALKKAFADHDLYAGLGTVLMLGATPRSVATRSGRTRSAAPAAAAAERELQRRRERLRAARDIELDARVVLLRDDPQRDVPGRDTDEIETPGVIAGRALHGAARDVGGDDRVLDGRASVAL
jgi:7,8-dihydropterin-6-yl-methyl-4-(beta-D-ribofuranosyl)aminobenzene 5'-phosphate synthase